MTANQLQYQKNAEDRRHNQVMEQLQDYANFSGRLNALASQTSASAAVQQAATAQQRAGEEARHNVIAEGLTRKANEIQSRQVNNNFANTLYKNETERQHYERIDTEAQRHARVTERQTTFNNIVNAVGTGGKFVNDIAGAAGEILDILAMAGAFGQ